ncbi:KTSC domain-containing protein [Lutibacter sp.]|uniref:KTSC domain-containing protein n=1 Tax=Lutibacter sp. TaxID=1925666 RepID=UPI001A27728B|nr:KTSC domain-containing protein [Lutibacter sp.]MBI9040270.1 KTSC domain-containing protein [Lutibacter sp.]
MKIKKVHLYSALIGVILNLLSCNSQSCNELPTQFNSYQQAVSEVKSTNFTFEDRVNTSRSSLIKSASFYSCDSKIGFLLVKIRSTKYIYQNVPISVWENFKQAESFGSFYNRNVKGSYQLKIKN